MSLLSLTIIVPVLNEASCLEEFLRGLSLQEHIRFEVVVSDGGSEDGTVALVENYRSYSPYRLELVCSLPGRAQQMNAGARRASSDWLLFLHADSRFEDPHALMLAFTAMQREHDLADLPPCAGHFPIHFERRDSAPSLGYAFYEAKSRLDLAGCVHGDQGCFMHRIFFERVGCFDESLPMLEDVAMADSVSAVGRWVLLPGELVTSARRFESEGLLERQTLNALIMNFRHIGWSAFFEALPDIYLLQAQTSALKLLPVWIVIRDLFAKLPLHDRRRLWCATGGYVRSQAWQLVFFWHCRRQFHRGQVATMGPHELSETMRGFERLTNNPFGRSLAALLVWVWFYSCYALLVFRYRRSQQDR